MIKNLLICLGTVFAISTQAQTKLIFQQNAATDEFVISAIDKITFSTNSLTIFKNDKSTVQKQFVDFSKILFQLATGVNEVKSSDNAFSVYPTTALNEIKINAPGLSGNSGQLTIYSALGQIFYNKAFSLPTEQTVSVENLSQGIYYVLWSSNGAVYQSKFIKK